MIAPIYQVFVGKNNIASNLSQVNVSEADRASLFAKEEASRKSVGATMLAICNSAWADEERPWWGVIRFPNLEARIQHTRNLQEMGWFNYADAFSLLGTAEHEPEPVTVPNPIYKLWIIRSSPAGMQLFNGMARGLSQALWEKHDAIQKEADVQTLLFCTSSWCNEAFPFFGVDVFPNIEANMRLMEGLNNLGWQSYFDSVTLLGTPM